MFLVVFLTEVAAQRDARPSKSGSFGARALHRCSTACPQALDLPTTHRGRFPRYCRYLNPSCSALAMGESQLGPDEAGELLPPCNHDCCASGTGRFLPRLSGSTAGVKSSHTTCDDILSSGVVRYLACASCPASAHVSGVSAS